jgi:hypothetical protein
MKEISSEIEDKVAELNTDPITTRNDPVVKALWNRLCLLHMRGVLACEDHGFSDSAECRYIQQPQACIKLLHLKEEETCCSRFFARKEEISNQ